MRPFTIEGGSAKHLEAGGVLAALLLKLGPVKLSEEDIQRVSTETRIVAHDIISELGSIVLTARNPVAQVVELNADADVVEIVRDGKTIGRLSVPLRADLRKESAL